MTDGTRRIQSSQIEVSRLMGIANRDLEQAQLEVLHSDTRFSLAYNAALQLATVALRLEGVRVRKDAFHARTFAELKERLPKDKAHIADYFDRARRKRHAAAYEQVNVVSSSELDDLVEQVKQFREWVEPAVREVGMAESSDDEQARSD